MLQDNGNRSPVIIENNNQNRVWVNCDRYAIPTPISQDHLANMIEILRQHTGNIIVEPLRNPYPKYLDRDNYVIAAYWFYSDYHDGQFSEFYKRSCKFGRIYKPAISESGYETLDDDQKEIYHALCRKHDLPIPESGDQWDYIEYRLPERFMSYLFNGDASGLEDDDHKAFDEWLEDQDLPSGHWAMPEDSEASFYHQNDFSNLGDNCVDLKYMIQPSEDEDQE